MVRVGAITGYWWSGMRERIRARRILKGITLKQWRQENNVHLFLGDIGESWAETLRCVPSDEVCNVQRWKVGSATKRNATEFECNIFVKQNDKDCTACIWPQKIFDVTPWSKMLGNFLPCMGAAIAQAAPYRLGSQSQLNWRANSLCCTCGTHACRSLYSTMCAAATGCKWYQKYCFYYNDDDDDDDDNNNNRTAINNNNNNNAYFKEPSPSWEVHRFWASQILRIVWSLTIHYFACKSPPLVPIRSQII